MDDDTGTFFSHLTNVNAALNFFINKESTNSEIICDYFNEKCFGGSSLSNECLLVSMYVHYLNLTQANNFKRAMKNERWMDKVVEKKLIEMKNELEEKFGKNEKGRGHW